MKPSKLFITSLLAAAAMSAAPVYGDAAYTSTGTDIVTAPATLQLDGGTTTLSGGSINLSSFSGTLELSGNNGGSISTVATNGGWGGRVSFAENSYTSELTRIILNAGIEAELTNVASQSGLTIEADNASFYFTGDTLSANLHVGSGGVRLNGNSGATQTYAGTITGSGNVYNFLPQSTNGSVIFTGNTSGFTGTWVSANNNAKIWQFGNGSAAAEGGAVGGNFGTSTQSIKLKFNFTGDYSVGGNVYASTLTIAGGNASFGGAVKASSISVASGATLSLSGAKVSLVNAIANSGTVNVDAATKFVLASLTGGTTSSNQTTYSLVNGGTLGSTWTSLDASNLDFAGSSYFQRGASATFASNGSMTVTDGTAGDLVWVGGENGAGTWNYSTTNTPWTNSGTATSFMNRDDVTFAGNATVTVDAGGVTANIVKISSGTVSFSGGTVTASALAGSGTIQLDSLTGLSVGTANDANRFAAWTGTVAFKNISDVSGVGLDLRNYGNENSKIVFDGVSGTGTGQGQGLWFVWEDFASGIEIGENGLTLTNGSGTSKTTFSGKISGNGLFWYKGTVAQTYKFTGDVSGFTGTLKSTSATFEFAPSTGTQTFNGKIVGDGTTGAKVTKSGAGELTFSASSSLAVATLTQSAGTLNISGAATITTLNQTAGTLTIGGATTVTGDYQGGKTNNGTSTLTIDAGAVMSVTGEMRGRHEYAGTSTVNVNGELSVRGNFWIARDGKGIVNINEGGTVVANTLTFGQAWDGASTKGSTVNLEEGGTLVVGTVVANTTAGNNGTPALNASALNLNGGTLGTSAESLTIDVKKGSKALSVVLGRGTTSTINTGKYNTATKTFTDTGAAISIVNAISGDGALKKTGAGTLTLSGNNTFSGGIEIAKGVVEATNAAALGAAANAVRISGGQLSIGSSTTAGVALNQTAITVVLGNAYKTTTALVGENGGALATGTTVTVTVDATDLNALGLVAGVANEYSIWNESLETSGATLELSGAFRTLLADAGWTSSISGGTLTISAIPEPSVFGLLAGLGALALAGTRRRRRK